MSRQGQSVSIVIRTRDVETRLCELLAILSTQTLSPSEIVVVDNFSSKAKLDEMRRLLQSARSEFSELDIPFKLVPVADNDFSHAYSTNAGVFAAGCALVCIMNAHSLPLSNRWLESGVAHFKNPQVAAVGGYSTPHADGTFWEKLTYGWLWRRFREISGLYAKDNYFSTTNCILRKNLWKAYPFDEKLSDEIRLPQSLGGEDYDWAREMLARNYRVVVEPRFCTYHSHGEGLSVLLSKYLAWRKVRKHVERLARPRKSTTRLGYEKPRYFVL